MRYLVIPLVLACAILINCDDRSGIGTGRGTYSEQQEIIDDFNSRYDEQLRRGEEQLRKSEEQNRKAEEQSKRFDALLDKWEEQARRYDEILARWEKMTPAKGIDSPPNGM